MAKKEGLQITVNGDLVTMWVASMGLLKTIGGRYSVEDIAYGDDILAILSAVKESTQF